jgi:hypothetical protein
MISSALFSLYPSVPVRGLWGRGKGLPMRARLAPLTQPGRGRRTGRIRKFSRPKDNQEKYVPTPATPEQVSEITGQAEASNTRVPVPDIKVPAPAPHEANDRGPHQPPAQ